MERWKRIKESVYLVSSAGFVRRERMKKILKLTLNKKYLQIGIKVGGKKKTFQVHRLVALAFLNNPYNLPEVNHIDHNTLNNNYLNLEWTSGEANKSKAKELRRYKNNGGYRFKRDKMITPQQARFIKKSKYQTKKLCKMFNLSRSQIKGIRSGRYWKNV